jgi:hypothetical protein
MGVTVMPVISVKSWDVPGSKERDANMEWRRAGEVRDMFVSFVNTERSMVSWPEQVASRVSVHGVRYVSKTGWQTVQFWQPSMAWRYWSGSHMMGSTWMRVSSRIRSEDMLRRFESEYASQ